MVTDHGLLSDPSARTPAQIGNVANPECGLVCRPHRLSMANASDQPATLANRLWLLLPVEEKRPLGTDQCSFGQEGACQTRASGGTQCRHAVKPRASLDWLQRPHPRHLPNSSTSCGDPGCCLSSKLFKNSISCWRLINHIIIIIIHIWLNFVYKRLMDDP